MLTDFLKVCKDSGIPIRGVLHVGAHLAEELGHYLAYNIPNIVFCEANPELMPRLHTICDPHEIKVCNVAFTDHNGTMDFHITDNDSMSSSLLPLKVHLQKHPHVRHKKTIKVQTAMGDEYLEKNGIDFASHNLLVMDIQGAETRAISGLQRYLNHCDFIYTEVNFEEMYEGCGLIEELESKLTPYGFSKVLQIDTGYGWGDALYIKVRK